MSEGRAKDERRKVGVSIAAEYVTKDKGIINQKKSELLNTSIVRNFINH